jgi:glycosyltransferase involved in cell wall biosynthesis
MYTILQVTPALDAGGVERTTIEVAEAIVKAGGRAIVASRGGRWARDLAQIGGELVNIPVHSKNPIEMGLNVERLVRLGRDRGVDLIHARSRAPAWSALWAARKLGVPFVTTYHGIYNAQSSLKRKYNSIMAKGDVVIANSQFTRDHVLHTYRLSPGRVVAIPRGVDLALFDPAAIDAGRTAAMRRRFGAPPHAPIVLLAGRLTAWKGQSVLIEAAARIESRAATGAHYVLAGDAQGRDGYEAALNAQIAAAGLTARFSLPGHIDDMPAAYAVADVAVFPSLEPEAFGRAAVEAQAMGVPVVAAGHGGLAETVVDGKTGLLVPPADASALAAAIERLLALAPEARRDMGARGAHRARTLYSKAALQAATLDVYRGLLMGRGAIMERK